jgi:pSer/pThr/pTyr-binding forkhead associated (FHA) protein
MNQLLSINLAHMEGRIFILGRQGHIFIDSPTASKHHAEISIIDGDVYLRDLDSTNGTFLLKKNVRTPFEEGYVDPQQSIVIGGKALAIQDLLAIAKNFVAVDDAATEVEVSEKWHKSASSSW